MTIALEELPMKKMAAGVFKTNCLAVMDEVQAKRETVIITKRGKPVAKLVPIDSGADDIYGYMAGKITITGDVVAPALTLKEWGNLA
jgi:antitoxin (DNA-binding transcriptional repressor) of toxin-antitoxin stability system